VMACVLLLTMLVAAVGLAAGCGEKATRPQDPHAFGRALVSALQGEDTSSFEPLIYTKSDVEYMLDHRIMKGEDPETMRQGWTNSYDRRRDEIERSFDRLHREGARHGLTDWSSVTFKTVDFSAITEGTFTRYEMIVEFTANGRSYVIDDATAWKTHRGLVLQSPPTLLTEQARQGLGR